MYIHIWTLLKCWLLEKVKCEWKIVIDYHLFVKTNYCGYRKPQGHNKEIKNWIRIYCVFYSILFYIHGYIESKRFGLSEQWPLYILMMHVTSKLFFSSLLWNVHVRYSDWQCQCGSCFFLSCKAKPMSMSTSTLTSTTTYYLSSSHHHHQLLLLLCPRKYLH